MSRFPSIFYHGNTGNASFMLYMGASVVCHAAIMIMMIVLSGFPGCEKNAFSDGVIHVDLVTVQGFSDSDAGGGDPGIPVSRPKPAADQVAAKAPVFEKPSDLDRSVVSVSEEEARVGIKTSFKKKTFASKRLIDPSVESSGQEAESEKEEDPLAGALSRLRETVDNNQRPALGAGQRRGTGSGPGVGSGEGGGQRQALTAMTIYKQEIRYQILSNWVYSDRLAGNDDGLKAVIGITIADDGRIINTWYDDRSGNDYFDESIYKAVVKSDPLPKPPPESPSPYTIGLKFTPSDVQSED